MAEHLPYINHLAAQEAGVTLGAFAELPDAEQQSWKQFVLEGPSRLRDTLMIAQIRNLFLDFMTGAKTLTPLDDEWMNGILENPQQAWNRKLEAAKAKKKADAVKRARALHEREQKAG